MAEKKKGTVTTSTNISRINNGGYHMNGDVAGSTYDHPDEEAWAQISSSFSPEARANQAQNTGGGSSNVSTQAVSAPVGGGGYDYASMISSMLAQQRAAAENAYRNSMGRLNEALESTKSSLRNNLDSTLNQLKGNYDYGAEQVNNDANKSLREAYVNYMLNKKNLNQGLSAMGVSGGASESTQANMYNNYGNSRNNINTTLSENLRDLLHNYQNNVASANQLYNSQYADAMNNYANNLNALESALAQNLVSTYSGGSLSNLANYASTLGNLVSSMANSANSWTPTENTLGVNTVSTTQGNDMGSVTDYAKYLAMAQQLANSGANQTQIITQLRNSGASPQTILSVFGQ